MKKAAMLKIKSMAQGARSKRHRKNQYFNFQFPMPFFIIMCCCEVFITEIWKNIKLCK
jgi:hypothetical protein